jgi:CheY-like chemotaxis protein
MIWDGSRRVVVSGCAISSIADGRIDRPKVRTSRLWSLSSHLYIGYVRWVQRDREPTPSVAGVERSAAGGRAAIAGAVRRSDAGRSAERRQHRSGVVLIVDDDADIRDAVREVLQDEGYATVEASQGREALELLRRAEVKPDLLLLDLMMPMMDGWQLRARLREDPTLVAIPIVIMTAHAGVLRAVTNVEPPTPVLAKPLDLDRLLELVAFYCKDKPPSIH